jgi:hypothetical protein
LICRERHAIDSLSSQPARWVMSATINRIYRQCAAQRVTHCCSEQRTVIMAAPALPSSLSTASAEQDPVPRGSSELLDGSRWKGHERHLPQNQKGTWRSAGNRRSGVVWLGVALNYTECTETYRNAPKTLKQQRPRKRLRKRDKAWSALARRFSNFSADARRFWPIFQHFTA